MVAVVLISVVLGGVLVWALYAEPAPPRPQPVRITRATTGADLARADFRIVPLGYEPHAVQAHLARIGAVHDRMREALAAAQPPSPGDQPPPSSTRAPVAGTGTGPGGTARDLAAQQSLGAPARGDWPPPGPRSVLDD